VGRVNTNKKKIINDPVYGFIKISFEGLFELIEHPYFQRLRRIKQLGLTYFVYPGATHTRFQHALGSLHLMGMAIQELRSKGVEIPLEEEEAALSAILLHDIGHGPFSHALEESIVPGIHHEALSLLFMHALNKEFKGRLDMAIQIFTGQYPKQFLHQLITGQLDMDRLDYLKRDSFFTGVTEGVIGSDRIVRMLNVVNDQLVVDHKGIYSIEKFLIARRLMYWQVYLHKAVLSSELLLLKILQRARELAGQGVELFCTPSFRHFLYRSVSRKDFFGDEKPGRHPVLSETVIRNLEMFAGLDDGRITRTGYCPRSVKNSRTGICPGSRSGRNHSPMSTSMTSGKESGRYTVYRMRISATLCMLTPSVIMPIVRKMSKSRSCTMTVCWLI
jgi:hypothetical protein